MAVQTLDGKRRPRKSCLPAAPVLTQVRRYMRRAQMSEEVFAERAHMKPHKFTELLESGRPWMEFDVAERLVLAMDAPELFHSELAEYYEGDYLTLREAA